MKPLMMLMALIFLVSIVYMIWGNSMHAQVTVEEAKFHDLQADYWNNAKTVRDNAATDSSLNSQLIEIKNYPSDLLRLKLVGVGRILTGIYALLFGILIALIIMPMRLAEFIRKGKK